jgi:hypothetical protein
MRAVLPDSRDRSVTDARARSAWIMVMTADPSELVRLRDQFWPSRRGHHFDELCRH